MAATIPHTTPLPPALPFPVPDEAAIIVGSHPDKVERAIMRGAAFANAVLSLPVHPVDADGLLPGPLLDEGRAVRAELIAALRTERARLKAGLIASACIGLLGAAITVLVTWLLS